MLHTLRRFWTLAALSILLLSSTLGVHAQEPAADAVAPRPVAHTVLPGVDTVTVTWRSAEPSRGAVLFGVSAHDLDQILYEPTGVRTEHSVTLTGLPADAQVYYVIADGGVPVGKNGTPYQVRTNPAPVVAPAAVDPVSVADGALRLQLVAPPGWTQVDTSYLPPDTPVLEVEGPEGALSLTRQPGEGLGPEEWFQQHRADYHATLIEPLGATEIGGRAAFVVAQPESCVTQAMIVAFVRDGDEMIVATWLDAAVRAEAPEFAAMMGSLLIGGAGAATALAPQFARFPAAPPAGDCSALQALVAAASPATVPATVQCPGAAMAIPSPGANQLPWGCFNFDPICRPYSTTTAYGSYFRLPHRAIDLAGEIGVTPVYATHAGTAVKYYASNIRISFSAPYAGKSVWMAHMAGYTGKPDYRTIVSGQKVTTGQHIGYTGYYNTSGNPPHLHISYTNNSYGTETWPTIDPTRMLSVKDVVWFDRWDAFRPLECSADAADAAEPDNFHTVAPLTAADGTPHHHDFHAPGDEDWIKFNAAAGMSYLVETSDLGSRNDTTVAIVAADGRTVLAQNDDAAPDSLASSLTWQATSTGPYYVRVRHYSYNGYEPFRPQPNYSPPVYGPETGYNLALTEFVPNIFYLRPAFASTYDSAQGLKASRANDGLGSTRWASAADPALPQWWWVQTDYQRFNRVDIYWNGDYAARYFVGWSNDNVTYYGYTFGVDSPGAYAHAMLALRSAKYVGVRMEAHAPAANVFSMDEVQAFRMPATAAAAASGPADLIELIPEGEPITVTREGQDAPHTLYLPAVGGH